MWSGCVSSVLNHRLLIDPHEITVLQSQTLKSLSLFSPSIRFPLQWSFVLVVAFPIPWIPVTIYLFSLPCVFSLLLYFFCFLSVVWLLTLLVYIIARKCKQIPSVRVFGPFSFILFFNFIFLCRLVKHFVQNLNQKITVNDRSLGFWVAEVALSCIRLGFMLCGVELRIVISNVAWFTSWNWGFAIFICCDVSCGN